MRFFLGTHMPCWLGRLDIPLFVSRRTLCRYRRLPQALGPWALDSGGFSELTMFGRWTITPESYVAEVRRYHDEIGNLEWAAIQDLMCEEVVLAKTGMTIEDHRLYTVKNYHDLRALDDTLPWAPVLQGWTLDDYRRCLDLYIESGADLVNAPAIGVGTVCRRQATRDAVEIMDALARDLASIGAAPIHAFGFKKAGLVNCARIGVPLGSADSLAWSFTARHSPPLAGCTDHKNCANCMFFALLWRDEILRSIEEAERGRLSSCA